MYFCHINSNSSVIAIKLRKKVILKPSALIGSHKFSHNYTAFIVLFTFYFLDFIYTSKCVDVKKIY